MRIGVNALLLATGEGYRRTGVSRYIDELVRHLPGALDADDAVTLFASATSTVPDDPMISVRRAPAWAKSPTARIAWEQAGLAMAARSRSLDVFHGTVNVLPRSLKMPGVVTIHDLAFLEWPEHLPWARQRYLASGVRDAARRAKLVITPSEATKADVVDKLGVEPGRIVVTPLATRVRHRELGLRDWEVLQIRYGLTVPFILFVGTVEPRKNLARLVRAFDMIAGGIEHELLLAGPSGWHSQELDRALTESSARFRIRRLGFVPDDHLEMLYQSAAVVAIPSISEGFGLPVLEAMAAGGAVVTSSTSSLPEVGGDGAHYVHPMSVEGIAQGLDRVIKDAELNVRLRENGLRRAGAFSWQHTARLTVAAYRQAAAGK